MKEKRREPAVARRIFPLLFGLLAASGCRGGEVEDQTVRDAVAVSLPAPAARGGISLEEAISKRRSVRSFTPRPLTRGEVSQLLWAAGGKTVDGVTGPTRSYPSAGGIYPLSIFLAAGRVEGIDPGIYRYDWQENVLVPLRPGDHRAALGHAAFGQGCVGGAPAVIVIAGDISRTAARYGERGEKRYLPMDAGHSGQNISLQAQSLGLGSVIVGAFKDDQVGAVLGLDGETPLYLIPVGHPAP